MKQTKKRFVANYTLIRHVLIVYLIFANKSPKKRRLSRGFDREREIKPGQALLYITPVMELVDVKL